MRRKEKYLILDVLERERGIEIKREVRDEKR